MGGQKFYSVHQAMDIISSSSASVQTVANKIINHGIVPVKKLWLYLLANKYVGECKSEVPLFWSGVSAGVKMMPIGDSKRNFYAHKDQRTWTQ